MSTDKSTTRGVARPANQRQKRSANAMSSTSASKSSAASKSSTGGSKPSIAPKSSISASKKNDVRPQRSRTDPKGTFTASENIPAASTNPTTIYSPELDLRPIVIPSWETMVTITKKHADEFAAMDHSLAVSLQEIAKMPNGSPKRRATEELRKTQAMLSKHNTYKMREANRAQAFLGSLKQGGKQNEDTIRNQIVTLLQVLDDQHEQMTVKSLLVALGKVKDLRPVDRTNSDKTNSAKAPAIPSTTPGTVPPWSKKQPQIKFKTRKQMLQASIKPDEHWVDDLFEEPTLAGVAEMSVENEKSNAVRDQDPTNQKASRQEVETSEGSQDQQMSDQQQIEADTNNFNDNIQPHDAATQRDDGSVESEQIRDKAVDASITTSQIQDQHCVDEAKELQDQDSVSDQHTATPMDQVRVSVQPTNDMNDDESMEHGGVEESTSPKHSSTPPASTLPEEASDIPTKQPKKPKRDSAIDSSPESQGRKSSKSKQKSKNDVSEDNTSSDATASDEPKRVGRKNIRPAGLPGVGITKKISRPQHDTSSENEEESEESGDDFIVPDDEGAKKTSKAKSRPTIKKHKSDELINNDDDAEDEDESTQNDIKTNHKTKPNKPKKGKKNKGAGDIELEEDIDLDNLIYEKRRKGTGGGSAPRNHTRQSALGTSNKRQRSEEDDGPLIAKKRALEGGYIALPKTRRPGPAANLDMMDIDPRPVPSSFTSAPAAAPVAAPHFGRPRMSLAAVACFDDDDEL